MLRVLCVQVTAKGKADEMFCWLFDAYLSLSKLLGRLCGANLAAISRMLNSCFFICGVSSGHTSYSWNCALKLIIVMQLMTNQTFHSWYHIELFLLSSEIIAPVTVHKLASAVLFRGKFQLILCFWHIMLMKIYVSKWRLNEYFSC